MDAFPAEIDALEQMMLCLRSHAKEAGMEEKDIRKIELACEEAIVNIISYAYPKEKGKLFIHCKKRGHRFEVTIKDQGIPFNPIDCEIDPDVDKPVQERRVGGLGIYLLRKAIDEVYYQRIEDENVLKLTFGIYS